MKNMILVQLSIDTRASNTFIKELNNLCKKYAEPIRGLKKGRFIVKSRYYHLNYKLQEFEETYDM